MLTRCLQSRYDRIAMMAAQARPRLWQANAIDRCQYHRVPKINLPRTGKRFRRRHSPPAESAAETPVPGTTLVSVFV